MRGWIAAVSMHYAKRPPDLTAAVLTLVEHVRAICAMICPDRASAERIAITALKLVGERARTWLDDDARTEPAPDVVAELQETVIELAHGHHRGDPGFDDLPRDAIGRVDLVRVDRAHRRRVDRLAERILELADDDETEPLTAHDAADALAQLLVQRARGWSESGALQEAARYVSKSVTQLEPVLALESLLRARGHGDALDELARG